MTLMIERNVLALVLILDHAQDLGMSNIYNVYIVDILCTCVICRSREKSSRRKRSRSKSRDRRRKSYSRSPHRRSKYTLLSNLLAIISNL